MGLSKHEEKVLQQIESALSEDSRFVKTVNKMQDTKTVRNRIVLSILTLFLGMTVFIVGLVAPWKIGDFPVISVVGFLLMFFAIAYYFLIVGGKYHGNKFIKTNNGFSNSRKREVKSSWGTRLEERFRNRFN